MNNLKQSTIEKAYQFALDNRDNLDISMRTFKGKKEFTTVKDLIDGEYSIFIHIIIDKDQLSKIRKDLQNALNTIDMQYRTKYGIMISVHDIVKSNSIKLIVAYNAKNGLGDLYYKKIDPIANMDIDTPFYPSHILRNKHGSAMILKNWAELLENDKLKELAEIFLEN